MLLVDLRFFHSEEHDPTVKESGAWVGVWVAMAVIFGIILAVWQGATTTAEYFAGYLIEYSLSVDNMFVFVVIFSYFKIPRSYQHQVLFYGILGAMVFRGIFIAVGVALIRNFEWMLYIFGAFLVFSSYRIARGTEEIHPEDNPVLKFFSKRFRSTTRFDGQKLFTIEDGKRVATPLFVTLLFVETTDIVFAVDSIPAILAITPDPFIILTSNVFAILGLRALYFLLAGVMDRFHLLKYGLAVILAFVGLKMLATAIPCGGEAFLCHEGHVAVPIWLSLTVIITTLAVTAILSLVLEPSGEHFVEADDDDSDLAASRTPGGGSVPLTDPGSASDGPRPTETAPGDARPARPRSRAEDV
ncbi:MAG: TerC/Alx family metal homeostasis membrane protein [Actinobacteria bacterium]|nr:TerC/Alx family metal homeostasis membrane protein [Actinomycetota bacterium]